MIPWRVTFVYGVAGSETTWRTLLPVRPWDREVGGEGGARRSATGVFAAYNVRRDNILLLTLRFFEHEWQHLYDLICWGQTGEDFLFYPNVSTDPAEVYTVDLESPRAGEKYKPTRSEQYVRAHELTIALRRIDGQPWNLEYAPTSGLAWGPVT
jgi:hypothetical protein